MAIDRTAKLTLRTETEGETGAFDDAAASIERLGEAAEAATPKLEQAGDAVNSFGDKADDLGNVLPDITQSLEDVAAAQDKGAASAEKHVGQIRNLGDVFEGLGGKLGSQLLVLKLVWESLKEGWEAGEKLRAKLNELTDGGFDRFVQKGLGMTAWAELFTGALDDSGEAAERLKNQLNVLAKEGIDTTGMSAEAVQAAFDSLGKKMQAEALEFATAHRTMAEAAEENAERQAAAAKKIADTWQQHLDEAQAFMTKRTEAELAANAELDALLAKKREERAQAEAAALEAFTADIARRLAEANAKIAEALGTDPNVAGLQEIGGELDTLTAKAGTAAAALTAVLSGKDLILEGNDPGPFPQGTPRYAPEGGFRSAPGGPGWWSQPGGAE